ncbi:MAG: DUF1611 domain-containing protein [Pirellulaceae bacterium]|nr:DUF1611 domain-containing protein [Pirellulaceae bacterium]
MSASAWTPLPQHHRIALLTDGFSSPQYAKTAISLLKYRPNDIVAVIDQQLAGKMADELFGMGQGVPVVAGLEKIAQCDAIYLGIATAGGQMPETWRPLICQAIERKIDIVSGLHEFLVEDPQYVQLASISGSRLVDVRRNRFKTTARGLQFRPQCIRVHSVGSDCSIGKMVTTLEVEQQLQQRGYRAKFIATGQTGIMITGQGAPIDCVVSDFVNGAIEGLVAEHQDHDFLLIEGQGSISHPAFSAVTSGLLHGCAPQGLIFCYEAGRTHVKGLPTIPLAPMEDQMAALLAMANLRSPCQFVGLSINTRSLTDRAANDEVAGAEDRFGLPACDVYRHGAGKLADACEELRKSLLGKP